MTIVPQKKFFSGKRTSCMTWADSDVMDDEDEGEGKLGETVGLEQVAQVLQHALPIDAGE
jgi:hypothetical protein